MKATIQKVLGVSVCTMKTKDGSFYASAKTHSQALADCFKYATAELAPAIAL